MQNQQLAFRLLTIALLYSSMLSTQIVRAEPSSGGMKWVFTSYIWASDTSIKASIKDHEVADSELKFDDLVDKIEFGFQGHLEGYGDQYGFFVDFTYMSISDQVSQHEISVDADMDTGIYELAAVYNLSGIGTRGFSLFGGLRYLSGDQKLKFQGEGSLPIQHTTELDNSWTDIMVGARYVRPLSARWNVVLRGDYSGGDTEGASNLQGFAAYAFKKSTVLLGYRYFQFELQEGPIKVENTLSGPEIGVLLNF